MTKLSLSIAAIFLSFQCFAAETRCSLSSDPAVEALLSISDTQITFLNPLSANGWSMSAQTLAATFEEDIASERSTYTAAVTVKTETGEDLSGAIILEGDLGLPPSELHLVFPGLDSHTIDILCERML